KETFIHDTCGKSERREEERGFGFVIWFCSLSFSETSPSSSSLSEAIFSVSVVPRRNGGTPCLLGSSASLNRVSPWLIDETKSLSLRGSSIDRRRTSLSTCLLEFIADWVISLSVGLLDGEGRLCLWRYLNRKVRFGLAVALVNGEGGLCRRLSANRSDEGINSRLICSVERVLGKVHQYGYWTKEYTAS
ncbi:hypothetical protein HID58_083623, partial [Brassica napus]